MELFHAFHKLATDEGVPEVSADLQEDFDRLAVLEGVKAFPMRVKCATLAWHTLDSALKREMRLQR